MSSPPHAYVADLFPNRRSDDAPPHTREHMSLSSIVRLSGTAIIIWRDPSAVDAQPGDLREE